MIIKSVHISYDILEFVHQKIRFTMKQHQHVAYPGLLILFMLMPWSQGIIRHGIDQITRNIPSLAWEELTHWSLEMPHGVIGTCWALVLGLYSLRRRRLTGTSIGIPMVNLRRSDDRLRFIMGIPILIRRRLLSEYGLLPDDTLCKTAPSHAGLLNGPPNSASKTMESSV